MFWKKKKKKSKDKKPSREELHAEAMKNVRAAREQIGEETLDRIAAAMTKKQNSPIEQAKAKIQNADSDRVVDEILLMMDEKD